MFTRLQPTETPAAQALTRLILSAFRFNGEALAAGDRLTREFGLSSALWQVLGAIDDGPLTVAQIARNMGLTRQSVRRTAAILERKGFVTFQDNPNHKRAKLAALTESGREAHERVMRVHRAWANTVTTGLDEKEIEGAATTLETLCSRL